MINGAISALLTNEGDQAAIGLHALEEQFLALRRLVASKAGFNAFTQLPKYGSAYVGIDKGYLNLFC